MTWADLLFHALDALATLTFAYQSFVDGAWHGRWFAEKRTK